MDTCSQPASHWGHGTGLAGPQVGFVCPDRCAILSVIHCQIPIPLSRQSDSYACHSPSHSLNSKPSLGKSTLARLTSTDLTLHHTSTLSLTHSLTHSVFLIRGWLVSCPFWVPARCHISEAPSPCRPLAQTRRRKRRPFLSLALLIAVPPFYYYLLLSLSLRRLSRSCSSSY